MNTKLKILVLCTGNSCRSQMAEALINKLKKDKLEAYSAGIEAHGINPYAVKVMQEEGIDISNNESKTISTFKNIEFDYVLTVCSNAEENCPYFPAKTKMFHHGFEDPPQLAKKETTEEGILKHYRRIRDEIKAYIEHMKID